ncbi:hypothetical protein C8R47DRAFT_1074590 [Mycena vitilis]|nr:hypothetical protein C8R47DRAFT_1074590 [Mycena vitilis]
MPTAQNAQGTVFVGHVEMLGKNVASRRTSKEGQNFEPQDENVRVDIEKLIERKKDTNEPPGSNRASVPALEDIVVRTRDVLHGEMDVVMSGIEEVGLIGICPQEQKREETQIEIQRWRSDLEDMRGEIAGTLSEREKKNQADIDRAEWRSLRIERAAAWRSLGHRVGTSSPSQPRRVGLAVRRKRGGMGGGRTDDWDPDSRKRAREKHERNENDRNYVKAQTRIERANRILMYGDAHAADEEMEGSARQGTSKVAARVQGNQIVIGFRLEGDDLNKYPDSKRNIGDAEGSGSEDHGVGGVEWAVRRSQSRAVPRGGIQWEKDGTRQRKSLGTWEDDAQISRLKRCFRLYVLQLALSIGHWEEQISDAFTGYRLAFFDTVFLREGPEGREIGTGETNGRFSMEYSAPGLGPMDSIRPPSALPDQHLLQARLTAALCGLPPAFPTGGSLLRVNDGAGLVNRIFQSGVRRSRGSLRAVHAACGARVLRRRGGAHIRQGREGAMRREGRAVLANRPRAYPPSIARHAPSFVWTAIRAPPSCSPPCRVRAGRAGSVHGARSGVYRSRWARIARPHTCSVPPPLSCVPPSPRFRALPPAFEHSPPAPASKNQDVGAGSGQTRGVGAVGFVYGAASSSSPNARRRSQTSLPRHPRSPPSPPRLTTEDSTHGWRDPIGARAGLGSANVQHTAACAVLRRLRSPFSLRPLRHPHGGAGHVRSFSVQCTVVVRARAFKTSTRRTLMKHEARGTRHEASALWGCADETTHASDPAPRSSTPARRLGIVGAFSPSPRPLRCGCWGCDTAAPPGSAAPLSCTPPPGQEGGSASRRAVFIRVPSTAVPVLVLRYKVSEDKVRSPPTLVTREARSTRARVRSRSHPASIMTHQDLPQPVQAPCAVYMHRDEACRRDATTWCLSGYGARCLPARVQDDTTHASRPSAESSTHARLNAVVGVRHALSPYIPPKSRWACDTAASPHTAAPGQEGGSASRRAVFIRVPNACASAAIPVLVLRYKVSEDKCCLTRTLPQISLPLGECKASDGACTDSDGACTARGDLESVPARLDWRARLISLPLLRSGASARLATARARPAVTSNLSQRGSGVTRACAEGSRAVCPFDARRLPPTVLPLLPLRGECKASDGACTARDDVDSALSWLGVRGAGVTRVCAEARRALCALTRARCLVSSSPAFALLLLPPGASARLPACRRGPRPSRLVRGVCLSREQAWAAPAFAPARPRGPAGDPGGAKPEIQGMQKQRHRNWERSAAESWRCTRSAAVEIPPQIQSHTVHPGRRLELKDIRGLTKYEVTPPRLLLQLRHETLSSPPPPGAASAPARLGAQGWRWCMRDLGAKRVRARETDEGGNAGHGCTGRGPVGWSGCAEGVKWKEGDGRRGESAEGDSSYAENVCGAGVWTRKGAGEATWMKTRYALPSRIPRVSIGMCWHVFQHIQALSCEKKELERLMGQSPPKISLVLDENST